MARYAVPMLWKKRLWVAPAQLCTAHLLCLLMKSDNDRCSAHAQNEHFLCISSASCCPVEVTSLPKASWSPKPRSQWHVSAWIDMSTNSQLLDVSHSLKLHSVDDPLRLSTILRLTYHRYWTNTMRCTIDVVLWVNVKQCQAVLGSVIAVQGAYCGRNIKPCTGQFKEKVSCGSTRWRNFCRQSPLMANVDHVKPRWLTSADQCQCFLLQAPCSARLSCMCADLTLGFNRFCTSCSIKAWQAGYWPLHAPSQKHDFGQHFRTNLWTSLTSFRIFSFSQAGLIHSCVSKIRIVSSCPGCEWLGSLSTGKPIQ